MPVRFTSVIACRSNLVRAGGEIYNSPSPVADKIDGLLNRPRIICPSIPDCTEFNIHDTDDIRIVALHFSSSHIFGIRRLHLRQLRLGRCECIAEQGRPCRQPYTQ
ncbi:hypothetical protein D3C85_1530610 [compost metagenome]